MNIFANIPQQLPEELIDLLAEGPNVRIERIISEGHASPDDFWYDQEQSEWVMIVAGSAVLEFEDESLIMNPGDHILIPAHRKHRVGSTSSEEKTIWLAVFYD